MRMTCGINSSIETSQVTWPIATTAVFLRGSSLTTRPGRSYPSRGTTARSPGCILRGHRQWYPPFGFHSATPRDALPGLPEFVRLRSGPESPAALPLRPPSAASGAPPTPEFRRSGGRIGTTQPAQPHARAGAGVVRSSRRWIGRYRRYATETSAGGFRRRTRRRRFRP